MEVRNFFFVSRCAAVKMNGMKTEKGKEYEKKKRKIMESLLPFSWKVKMKKEILDPRYEMRINILSNEFEEVWGIR